MWERPLISFMFGAETPTATSFARLGWFSRRLAIFLASFALMLGASANASQPSALTQKFLPIYGDLESSYQRSDVREIEAYGRAALRMRGPDRLYALWSVLFVYKDHMVYDKLRAWIATVRSTARAEHDVGLAAFADFFQFSLEQDGSRSAEGPPADWSRFLDHSGPDIRLMALVEVIGHYVDAHQWSRASESALAGLSESDTRGPRAWPVKAELHQHYANALSAMGDTEGAIDQVLLATSLDRQVRLRTQDLARIYDLANMAADAGELDVADHLARIHFRLAKTSNGPNPRFWTRYLCASVADAREEWGRVIGCTRDLAVELAHPRTSTAARLLAYRALARARLGDVAGARSDLATMERPMDNSIPRDPQMEDLIRIYIAEASGDRQQAFAALDRRRREDRRASEIAHRRGVSEVVAALDNELRRKRAESAQLAKAVEIGHRLTLAWSLIAALLGTLILGGLGWSLHLRRISDRLRIASEQADAANEAKSRFLAVMSHELRTPLNGLLGMAQVLRSTPLTAEQRDLVETLEDSGGALLAILNDVLDLAKIESGHIEIVPEAADVRVICESVIAVYSFTATERGDRIEFQVEGEFPERLMFDALRVRQCLANLLSNAIKFTKNGVISVRLSVSPDAHGRGDRVRVDVADSGIGMNPQTLQKLFGAFIQADASITRQYGGTGLGLNITQRLARMMGGEVTVESREGLGSVFTLTFQADTPPSDFPVADGALGRSVGNVDIGSRHGGPEGLKVLVVDDHPTNRKVAHLFLTQFGCEVIEAHNGQAALDCLAAGHIDLVLMDVNMPVMDGLEATRRIRAHPRWAALPVIALTADAGKQDIETCLVAGMNAHLAKPIDAGALLALIVELTGEPQIAAA